MRITSLVLLTVLCLGNRDAEAAPKARPASASAEDALAIRAARSLVLAAMYQPKRTKFISAKVLDRGGEVYIVHMVVESPGDDGKVLRFGELAFVDPRKQQYTEDDLEALEFTTLPLTDADLQMFKSAHNWKPATTPRPAALPRPRLGFGRSRAQVMEALASEFALAAATQVGGAIRQVASSKDQRAHIELIGPDPNLFEASLMFDIPGGVHPARAPRAETLRRFLAGVVPDCSECHGWALTTIARLRREGGDASFPVGANLLAVRSVLHGRAAVVSITRPQ